MEPREVRFVSRAGEPRGMGTFHFEREGNGFRLRLLLDGAEFSAKSDDYFEALQHIRLQLEPSDRFPLCYGASRNCYPSGMARDMGGGLSVYKLTIGAKPARPAVALVAAFDDGPDIELATVAEQDAFFERWLASVTSPASPR
jgi:hypothetical protein